MRRTRFAFALFAPAFLLACSSQTAPSDAAPGQIASPIINGTLDSGAHPAVVAVLSKYGSCSGTVIKTDVPNNVGWVLTAAHCVLPDDMQGTPAPTPGQMAIVFGDDYGAFNAKQHPVLAFASEPSAMPPKWDLAVVKFSGVTAQTAVLPLTNADLDKDLAAGVTMEMVGFGATTVDSSDQNTRKWKMQGVLADNGIDSAVTDLTISVQNGPNGENTCHGDSGGPWLRTIGTQQYVVGVTSVGQDPCEYGGTAARVLQGLDSFVLPYINGGTVVATCDVCENDSYAKACKAEGTACAKNADCLSEVNKCGCLSADTACVDKCFQDHAAGDATFATLKTCLCQPTACAAECAASLCKDAMGAGGAGGAGGGAAGGSGGAGGGSAGGEAGSGGAAGAGEGGSAGVAGATTGGNGGAPGGGNGGVSGTGGASAGGAAGQSIGGSGSGAAAGKSAAGGAPPAGGTPGNGGDAGTAGSSANPAATDGSSDSGGCAVTTSSGRAPGALLLVGLAALVRRLRVRTRRCR